MEPTHHRADGNTGHFGNLLVREPFNIRQQDRHPEVLWERLNGLGDLDIHEAFEDLILG